MVMSTTAVPVSRQVADQVEDLAWMVTSSAVVGRPPAARAGAGERHAIMTRWRMPPRELVRVFVQAAFLVPDADLASISSARPMQACQPAFHGP